MNTRPQLIAGVFGAIAFLLMPAAVSAAGDTAARTVPVIAPAGQSCQPLSVLSVLPYVYDGQLDSFDVTLPDGAYVGLIGTAGEQSVPFNQMVRFTNPDGSLRYHVDLDPMSARGSVPVSITLLSAIPGQPVCLSVINFTVTVGDAQAAAPVPHASTPTEGRPSEAGTNGPKAQPSTAPADGDEVATTSDGAGSPLRPLFAGMCDDGDAFELWFVLLALFIVIAAFAALAEAPILERFRYLPYAIILIPLVLLLAFWYFAPDCRTGSWIPFALLIIAAAGCFIAYRTNRHARFIGLPPAHKDQV